MAVGNGAGYDGAVLVPRGAGPGAYGQLFPKQAAVTDHRDTGIFGPAPLMRFVGAHRVRVVNRSSPFLAGFRAARANLIPGLVIQALMLALVLLYYCVPAARPGFEWLAAAKASGGFGFSFGSA